MLISFTGPQNTGKTTLLKELALRYTDEKYNATYSDGSVEEHNKFHFVTEVTRRIQREVGFEINQLAGDSCQIVILADHIKNVEKYKRNRTQTVREYHVLDRCLLDGYLYTKFLHDTGKCTKEVYELSKRFFYDNYIEYDVIFYCDPNIPLDNDGVRDNTFRNQMINLFEYEIANIRWNNHTRRPDLYGVSGPPVFVRLEGSVEQRMEQIKYTLTL